MSAEEAPNALEQFAIRYYTDAPDIFGYNLNFTNSSLLLVIAAFLVIAFCTLGMRKASLVPGRLQGLVEMTYEMVANTIRDSVGNEGRQYFPFIFTTFMLVMVCNLISLAPHSFAVTSHIAVTFALASVIFIAITCIGFAKHGLHFLGLFLPEGTPLWMAPLMILIELFSYLARPISLSIRLAANMTAGHIILFVVGGFVTKLAWYFGWAPMVFLIGFTGFEVFIAILQAYIFTILTCIYLNDAIHLH